MSVKLEDLKNAMPLIDFIEAYYPDVQVTRSGVNTFVTCPYHDEDTPSCLINHYDDKSDTFKCFSCQKTGSIIDYVGAKEKIDVTPGSEGFREVCKKIGSLVGMKVSFTPPNPYFEAYKDEMDAHVARYFKEFKNNEFARNYVINERHLTKETIIEFRLGCTPPNEYEYRKKGMISNRLAFPIFEMTSNEDYKCVAMAYRKLDPDEDGPKYINDANLDGRKGQDPNLKGLFIKGEFLYGYPQAYKSIVNMQSVIVVEGYMDVISLHQTGFKNTVSCMGTALTEEQADILRRLTSNLYLFLDGDEAGQKNMRRVLPMLLSKGFNVKIIKGTNDRDPADICVDLEFDERKVREYFKNHTENAVTMVLNEACKSYEDISARERIKALRAVMPIIEQVKNPIDREVYESQLKKRLDLR